MEHPSGGGSGLAGAARRAPSGPCQPRFKRAVRRVILALSFSAFQRRNDLYRRRNIAGSADSSRALSVVPEESDGKCDSGAVMPGFSDRTL